MPRKPNLQVNKSDNYFGIACDYFSYSNHRTINGNYKERVKTEIRRKKEKMRKRGRKKEGEGEKRREKEREKDK